MISTISKKFKIFAKSKRPLAKMKLISTFEQISFRVFGGYLYDNTN